jgi:enoyl-CoA hydratase
MWLALTGARLKAADCLIADIATNYVPAAKLDAVRHLAAAAAACEHPLRMLQEGLEEIDEEPGPALVLTPEAHALIDRLFGAASVQDIIANLAEEGSDWSKTQVATLATKSPQTLKVAFRQLREGEKMDNFADEMRQEYRIAARVVQRHDFLEGVRALIVDKDNQPRWNPPTLAGVTDAMLDDIFAPLPADEEWKPL